MAFELMAGKKQKRKRTPGFQFSISLDAQTTQELMVWMQQNDVDRSAAVRYLIQQGLMYETVIKPDAIRRAREEAEREKQVNGRPERRQNPESTPTAQ
jgi:glutamyl/glutaminyl-tRNA synthetase